MPRVGRDPKLANTMVFLDANGDMTARYYDTDIVKWSDELIMLRTGGWATRSTIDRMNTISRLYELGYVVFTRKKIPYVEYKEKVYDLGSKCILRRKAPTPVFSKDDYGLIF